MNPHYISFIELGKSLANEKGLKWDFPVDEQGYAADGVGWNLTECVGDVPPPSYSLRDLGTDTKTLSVLNVERARDGLPVLTQSPLSPAWRDLVKAAVVDQLLVRRNTTSHVYQNIARPLRVLATCATREPWELALDDFQNAIRVAKSVQASGKLADLLIGLVKVVIDPNHICDIGQVYHLLGAKRIPVRSVKARQTLSEDELRSKLEERKREERLPSRRAFWELVRIVMTERPRSFMDELRFAAIRTMIVTGMRVGEAALLPFDWRRERTFLDAKGQSAGDAGGFSSALMLRHFAEKQQEEESDSRVLRESTQAVPEMFRELLVGSLERIAHITSPLRETLKMQCETGRLLPWFKQSDIVPFTELYTRISGNPFWLDVERGSFISEYRENFDPAVLRRLHQYQSEKYEGSTRRLDMAIYMFGNRLQKQMRESKTGLRFRTSAGTSIYDNARMSWNETYLNVGELETHLRTTTPTKISDTAPMLADSGFVQAWELLFIHPKRSLAEERNDGLCDVTRYFSISRPDSTLIGNGLGDRENVISLFERYGATKEDQELRLESHLLRHLQNTELFRLGVADTIISKRYNRRSVAQSYEYDHRSLAEDLEQVSIPEDIELQLGEKAATVAKMIKVGKAKGPVVDAFLRIQAQEGDAAAYQYLQIEADGFHATPYGHCLNSFTVDPCPKHLECFSNCRHLSATDLPENRANLIRLEGKFKIAIETIRSRPSTSIGWKNQLHHAEVRLTGVQKLLETPPGERVFPDGVDLSTVPKRSIVDE